MEFKIPKAYLKPTSAAPAGPRPFAAFVECKAHTAAFEMTSGGID